MQKQAQSGAPEKRRGPSFDIVEFLAFGLLRYRYWIVLFTVAGLAYGTFQALTQKNMYDSRGKFLVRAGQRERVTPEDALPIGPTRAKPLVMRDQMKLLESQELYELVARKVGLRGLNKPWDPRAFDTEHTPKLTRLMHEFQAWWFDVDAKIAAYEEMQREPESQKAIEAAAAAVRARTSFKGGRSTQVLSVFYLDSSPEHAQFMCGKVMEACQERHREVYASMTTNSLLQQELEVALAEAEEAEERFNQHTEECGFYDLSSVKERCLNRIRANRERLGEAEIERQTLEREATIVAQRLLEVEPTREELKTPTSTVNPEYERIQTRIRQAKAELEQLKMKFNEDYPHFQRSKEIIDARLAKLEEDLRAEPQYVQAGESYYATIPNEEYVALVAKQRTIESKLEVLRVQESSWKRLLEGAERDLADIRDCEPVHKAMRADLAQNRNKARSYQAAQHRQETLEMIDAQEELSNLVIIQEPSYRPVKVLPKRDEEILFGLGVGAGIGVAFALLRQLLDGKVRFRRTAKNLAGGKVLGVLPELKGWRLGRRRLEPALAGPPPFDVVELVFLGILRFRYWVVLFAVLGVAGGTIKALSMPNTYSSRGKFLVRHGQREQLTPENALVGGTKQRPLGIRDEIKILDAPEFYEQIAREVGLKVLSQRYDPRVYDNERTPTHVRWMHAFQAKLMGLPEQAPDGSVPAEEPAVSPNTPKALDAAAEIVKSNIWFGAREAMTQVLGVEYSASSPELAQYVCSKIMRACQDRHRDVFSGMSAKSFLAKQLDTSMARADEASDRFNQHTEQCGFFDIERAKFSCMSDIQENEDLLSDGAVTAEIIDAEIAQIEEELTEIEPTKEELKLPVTQRNKEYERIQNDIRRVKADMEEVARMFKEGSVPYETKRTFTDDQIALLEEELRSTPQYIQVGEARYETVPNEAYTELVARKNKLAADHELLEVRMANWALHLEQKKRELAAIRDCEPIHRVMLADIQQAESKAKSYVAAQNRQESIDMIDAQEELSNLVIMQEPDFNPVKSGPQRTEEIIKGLSIGAAIGAVFACLRQFLDARVRYRRTAKEIVRGPVFGVVREQKDWRRIGQKLQKEAAQGAKA